MIFIVIIINICQQSEEQRSQTFTKCKTVISGASLKITTSITIFITTLLGQNSYMLQRKMEKFVDMFLLKWMTNLIQIN